MKFLSLLFFVFLSIINADVKLNKKINILTDYLMKENNTTQIEARNKAIATVYGKPVFDGLTYDDDSEMFFGRVKATNVNISKKVNFYMPKKYAYDYMNNTHDAKIEVEHKTINNELKLIGIELNYKGLNYPMTVKTDTSISLKIGVYLVANQDTKISANKNGIGGTIDLQELFDLQEDTKGLRIDLGYEFNQKHKMSLSYYSINNSNIRTIDPIEFDGSTIGGDINLEFNTAVYKLSYIYSAYKTNKFEFSTRIGIHLTEFDTILSTSTTVDGISNTSELVNLNIPAPLPTFGLGFNYDITTNLALKYHVDYFYLSSEVKGSMIDTQIELNYMLYDYLGFSLGINSTKMDFKAQIDKTNFGLSNDVSGTIASLIFRY